MRTPPPRQADADRLARLARLARLLDARFAIPGTRLRFGLDSLIGLIPGLGDAATAGLSAYIILEAARLGVPKITLAKMAWNVAIDGLLGTVPILGDLFDLTWKANLKNMRLIERHSGLPGRAAGPP